MLASQLINTSYPVVGLTDKVSFALQLMDDYDVQHLSVANEEKFVGLVSKSDLLDIDENNVIATLIDQLIKASVRNDEHFLVAVKIAAQNDLSIVPVINGHNELTGAINASGLLRILSSFTGNDEPGGIIVLEIERSNFSFGEISRLVETNDASITQLNTVTEAETGLRLVTIKINKIEISDIVATFQRYDYIIRYYFGEELYANELKENYNHLIAYLNL